MTNVVPVPPIARQKLCCEGAERGTFVTPTQGSFLDCFNTINSILTMNAQCTAAFEAQAQMFASVPPDQAMRNAKQKIIRIVEKVLQSINHESIVICYGSSANDCGDSDSDLDLCWCIRKPQTTFDELSFALERDESKNLLQKAYQKITRLRPVESCVFIDAFVHIVKFWIVVNGLRIEVDISLNNMIGVYNTLLLKFYASIDPRFGQMARIIKRWGSSSGLINPVIMLNTYAVRLMVIHFLQCGVTPAILPNLNVLFPEIVNGQLDVITVKEYIDGNKKFPNVPRKNDNKQSLTSLIFGFLAYWEHFDYANYGVSLKMARREPKSNYHLSFFLEEVYNSENVARNINGCTVKSLRDCFSRSLVHLFTNSYAFDSFINAYTFSFEEVSSYSNSLTYY